MTHHGPCHHHLFYIWQPFFFFFLTEEICRISKAVTFWISEGLIWVQLRSFKQQQQPVIIPKPRYEKQVNSIYLLVCMRRTWCSVQAASACGGGSKAKHWSPSAPAMQPCPALRWRLAVGWQPRSALKCSSYPLSWQAWRTCLLAVLMVRRKAQWELWQNVEGVSNSSLDNDDEKHYQYFVD